MLGRSRGNRSTFRETSTTYEDARGDGSAISKATLIVAPMPYVASHYSFLGVRIKDDLWEYKAKSYLNLNLNVAMSHKVSGRCKSALQSAQVSAPAKVSTCLILLSVRVLVYSWR